MNVTHSYKQIRDGLLGGILTTLLVVSPAYASKSLFKQKPVAGQIEGVVQTLENRYSDRFITEINGVRVFNLADYIYEVARGTPIGMPLRDWEIPKEFLRYTDSDTDAYPDEGRYGKFFVKYVYYFHENTQKFMTLPNIMNIPKKCEVIKSLMNYYENGGKVERFENEGEIEQNAVFLKNHSFALLHIGDSILTNEKSKLLLKVPLFDESVCFLEPIFIVIADDNGDGLVDRVGALSKKYVDEDHDGRIDSTEAYLEEDKVETYMNFLRSSFPLIKNID